MWHKYTAAAALWAFEKEAEPSWTLKAEQKSSEHQVFFVCRYIAFILSLKVYTAYEAMSNFAWATIAGIMDKEQSSIGSLPLARCCCGDGSECPLERIKDINKVILWNVTMTVVINNTLDYAHNFARPCFVPIMLSKGLSYNWSLVKSL